MALYPLIENAKTSHTLISSSAIYKFNKIQLCAWQIATVVRSLGYLDSSAVNFLTAARLVGK